METKAYRTVTALILLFSLVSSDNLNLYLRLDENYEVWWSMEDDSITFQVEVATGGWVGFGVSPNGGMAGSDVVIGWINNQEVVFHDRHAEGKFLPKIDDQQNWELLWHQKNDTHTKFRFKRLLETCDPQDLTITDETTRIMYAYNPEIPASVDAISYHGPTTRGSKSVFLKEETEHKFSEKPEDLHFWETRSPNVVITEESDTFYYCTFIKQPKLDKKHHIIEFDSVIQPGNEKLVHHIILYECTGTTDETVSKYADKPYYHCYTEENIPTFPFCLTFFVGWGIGGGKFYYPENVGQPFGLDETKWFLLEIHYDNPGLKRVVDNSGLRLVYTPKLRQYDSSVLSAGSLWYPCMVVPPKQKEFIVSGHLAPSCLNQRVPKEGLKVFAVLFHSHLIGKRMVIRHFRGDEELEPIASDLYYDFNLQHFRRLSKIRTILPNDHLILECTYDSSQRDEATFGGLSTREEMCLAFLMYYPSISLAIISSCPDPRNLLISLGAKEIFQDEKFLISPITGKNESFFDFLNYYPWDENSVEVARHAMMFSPQLNLCTDRGWKLVPNFVLSKYPKIKKRYRESNKCGLEKITLKYASRKPSKISFSSINGKQRSFLNIDSSKRRSINGTVLPYPLLDEFFS